MKTNTILNKSVKYDKIYHISDIHIRNTEEHIKIYQHVFDNLYKYLHGVKSDKSLIVITGDILHNKDKLTTTCETLCIDFLEKLSSIMTTIIIPGNHDFNEKANTKDDSLSTILYKRPFNNLYYLKLSGVYKFSNILFGFSSLIDNKFIKATDINDPGIKIGLYHGAVANSKNSQGFEFSKNSITNFEGYDFVLLGDIHYYQYLNEEKTMAYASSLISQNFAEIDLYHGVLVWDLKNKSSSYKIIHNDYRYDELDIKNNNIFYKGTPTKLDKLDLPSNGKLRINTMNNEQDFYNKTVFNIKAKYPNLNIVHNKLLSNSTVHKNKTNKINTITLQSIVDSEINKLPEETRKFIEKVLLKEIKSAIQTIDEKLNWKLLTLEFSNMFSYGPDNLIDFTKLTFDEITGLFGPNSIGKSSLIDILLFSLFDDYSRNYQDKHKLLSGTIINTKEKTFSCKVSFSVDNIIYFIEKEGKRMVAKSEHTFDTFKFTNYDFYKMESNNKIQLNGQDRFETLNKITSLIGNYSNFCVSSVCLQNNLRDKIDFFNMSPIEKKAFLNELLKFDIFKNIEQKYKDLLKETKINLKNIEKMDEYNNYNHNIDIQINELSELIVNHENTKLKLDEQLKNNNDELNKLYKKLKYVDDSIDCVLIDKQQIINDIKLYQNKLKKYPNDNFDEKIEEIYNTNLLLSSKLSSSNCDYNLEELIKQKNELIETISNIKIKINKLHLIKNKQTIILKNDKFEKQKMEKIIELKTNILPESKVISKNKFQKKIMETLRQIFALTQGQNYNEQINDTRINILNLENNINNIKACIKNTENILAKYDVQTIDNHIIKLYNKINFDEYYNNTTNVLNDYNTYYELNKVIETNNDIFTLLSDFNKCINKTCSNCLTHSQNIIKLFSKFNIHEECTIIKNKFIELSKLKNEYEQMIVYHNKKKLDNYQSILQIYSSMLDCEKDKLNKYLEETNTSVYVQFKNTIMENINKMEQNNLIHELNDITNTINENFLLLNNQIKEYNELSSELNLYETKLIEINKYINNYDNDNNLQKQIEANKNIIQELKINKNKMNSYNIELTKLNNILDNINNYEFNSSIYTQINSTKKNIQSITHNIISINNDYINNKHLQQKLINIKIKYQKYIEEINKYNSLIEIYENIIKITGPKGISRQIINIKLQHIEDTVNDIILPFINKQIIIIKEIEDIKVLINDGVSKYYSCGGMENFIIAMSFKIAFTNTFNIPQTGILFIDEGVSVLDKNHVSNFEIIANFIKQYYNHIILITHIDSFYDYTFDIINITRNKSKQSHVAFPAIIIKDEQVETTTFKTNKLNKPTQTKTKNKKKPLEIEV
jgi:DNA repair exonuclease SbcCD ATPase subunit